jgi:hypothetical protein
MLLRAGYAEYLAEVRERVCSHCPHRVPDGPPYRPECRCCGVELQLPHIVESIRDAGGALSEFDEAPDRNTVCARCHCLGGGCCPCPVAPLSALLVRAVLAVEERREQRERVRKLIARAPHHERGLVTEMTRAYEAATGTNVGCD